MFDIKWIRANPEAFDAALKERRGVPYSAADLIALDERRRAAIVALEELQASATPSRKRSARPRPRRTRPAPTR